METREHIRSKGKGNKGKNMNKPKTNYKKQVSRKIYENNRKSK